MSSFPFRLDKKVLQVRDASMRNCLTSVKVEAERLKWNMWTSSCRNLDGKEEKFWALPKMIERKKRLWLQEAENVGTGKGNLEKRRKKKKVTCGHGQAISPKKRLSWLLLRFSLIASLNRSAQYQFIRFARIKGHPYWTISSVNKRIADHWWQCALPHEFQLNRIKLF